MGKLTDAEWKKHYANKPKPTHDLCNGGDLSDGSLMTPPNWCDCPLGEWWRTTIENTSFEIVTHNFNGENK